MDLDDTAPWICCTPPLSADELDPDEVIPRTPVTCGHSPGLRVYGGRWVCDRAVDSGGNAQIHEGRDIFESKFRVALKTLRPDREGNLISRRQLGQEGYLLASLSCRYIVKLYDYGLLESGSPYLTLEWLDGADLRKVMARKQRICRDEALRVAHDISTALTHAHAQGVVHRDVTPRNIFCMRGSEPEYKLIDFGLAKGPGPERQDEGIIAGTLPYLAPELLETSTAIADARADIYAFAAVLFEIITGHPVFPSEQLGQQINSILFDVAPLAHEYCPGIPSSVSKVLARAMSKCPSDRPDSATSFYEELRRAWTSNDLERSPWPPRAIEFPLHLTAGA